MKRLFTSLILLISFAHAYAQELDHFEAWCPKYIREPNGNPTGITDNMDWQQWCEAKVRKGDLGENTSSVWIVYSDRENNATYTSSSLTSPTGKKLTMGQELYVAKVENGAALVFSTNRSLKWPKIDVKKVTYYGWISIDKLLLWRDCPKSKNQIYRKAFVVYDPSQADGSSIPKDPKFFTAPSEQASISSFDAKSLDILFIMKFVKVGNQGYYLLSSQAQMTSVGSDLYGWLPSTYVTPWDQRLALEPATDRTTINIYKNHNLKPAAYSRMEEAERYFNKEQMGNPIYKYEAFGTIKRMNPRIMRQPILERTDNSFIYKVAVTTSMDTTGKKRGGGQGYLEDRAENQANIDDLTKRQKNINIIFVVDATTSMDVQFVEGVVNALKNIKEQKFFSEKGSTSIRIGVVPYRDVKRTVDNYQPLTNEMDKVIAYFSDLGKKLTDGKGKHVAMFDGLEVALDCKKMGYDPSHSNYIILLGVAGDQLEDKFGNQWRDRCENIATKMAGSTINFMAYQIRNDGSNLHDEYLREVQKIQKTLTSKYIEKIKTPMEYKKQAGNEYKLMMSSSSKNDYIPIYSTNNYASKHGALSASIITPEIFDHVEEIHNIITNKIAKFNRLAEGGYRIQDDAEESAIRAELILAWGDTPQARAKIESTIRYMKMGGVAKFETYSPAMTQQIKERNGLSIYQYVLFFSGEELSELIRKLDNLVTKRSGDIRKNYQEAVIGMAQAMLGEFSSSQISNMDINELMNKIYGIPVTVSTVGGFSIKEILEMDEGKIKDYMRDFSNKLEELRMINAGDDPESRFEKNGKYFYWIPMDKMPGFKLTVD